jgi:hypothetical protein
MATAYYFAAGHGKLDEVMPLAWLKTKTALLFRKPHARSKRRVKDQAKRNRPYHLLQVGTYFSDY